MGQHHLNMFYVGYMFVKDSLILDVFFYGCVHLCIFGGIWFVLIIYSCSITLFLNSRPRNSPPRSYMTFTGHEYRTRHVVSTKYSIIIDFLSFHCVTSNHLVTGSIIVMSFNIRGSLPFIRILYGPMISTSSLFYGASSASLSDNLPFFF